MAFQRIQHTTFRIRRKKLPGRKIHRDRASIQLAVCTEKRAHLFQHHPVQRNDKVHLLGHGHNIPRGHGLPICAAQAQQGLRHTGSICIQRVDGLVRHTRRLPAQCAYDHIPQRDAPGEPLFHLCVKRERLRCAGQFQLLDGVFQMSCQTLGCVAKPRAGDACHARVQTTAHAPRLPGRCKTL